MTRSARCRWKNSARSLRPEATGGLPTPQVAGRDRRVAALRRKRGDVNSRRFEGGTVSIHPSRVQGQIYVILRFSWRPPRVMLLKTLPETW